MYGTLAQLAVCIACLILLKDKRSSSSLLLIIGSGGMALGGLLLLAVPLFLLEVLAQERIAILNWTFALAIVTPFFSVLLTIGFILHLKKHQRLLKSKESDISNIKGID